MSDYPVQLKGFLEKQEGKTITVGRQFIEDLANHMNKKPDSKIELIEERLKFIEAQFGIEFVPPHEVGPSYKRVQKEKEGPDPKEAVMDSSYSEKESSNDE